MSLRSSFRRRKFKAMNGLLWFGIFVFSAIALCGYNGTDFVSCIIQNSSEHSVNGYYAADNGVYYKLGNKMRAVPDVFAMFNLHSTRGASTPIGIIFRNAEWLIMGPTRVLFANSCSNFASASKSISCVHVPPSNGWVVVGKNDSSIPPIVTDQIGKLENSFESGSWSSSNIAQLLNNPVNTFILTAIFGIAYYLWAYNVDVAAVSYSYDLVVNKGEYWRIFTASMSHFDALHLLFNTMTLYQLGSLEGVYGSLNYLYLSFSLIVITMLICVGIDYVLIHRYGQNDRMYQQAIGYSCVLFAWMVALSVRLDKYCPIFIFPSLCVDTWVIPFPSAMQQALGVAGLPVNLGPFLLLFLTKLIIPRSSFYGHLSGIIIGYPLAWGWLGWFTPPVVVALLVLWWMNANQKFVWKLPTFDQPSSALRGFVAVGPLWHYYLLGGVSLFLIVYELLVVYWMAWLQQVVARGILIFFIWSAVMARKIEFYTESYSIQEDCATIIMVTSSTIAAMFVYDALNLTAILTQDHLLRGSGGLSEKILFQASIVLIIGLMLQGMFLIAAIGAMNDMPSCSGYLQFVQLDKISLYNRYGRYFQLPMRAFSGQGYRAANTQEEDVVRNALHNNNSRSDVEMSQQAQRGRPRDVLI